MNSHSMYLKKSNETICRWVNSKINLIEASSDSQEENNVPYQYKNYMPYGMIDFSRVSSTRNIRRKTKLKSKVEMVRSGIIQRRGNKKRMELMKKAKVTIKS